MHGGQAGRRAGSQAGRRAGTHLVVARAELRAADDYGHVARRVRLGAALAGESDDRGLRVVRLSRTWPGKESEWVQEMNISREKERECVCVLRAESTQSGW